MRRRGQVAGAISSAFIALLTMACAGAAPASAPAGHGTTQPPAAARASTPAPASTPPRPQAFEPAGASFVSPSLGWVLGSTGCADCAGLLMTTDGGSHWTALPAPPAGIGYDTQSPEAVTDVAFADARNGFLYGPAMLVTHDGGRSWARETLPPLPTFLDGAHSFAIGAGFAYAITQANSDAAYSLWRMAVGGGHWTRLPLPDGASAPVTWNGSLSVYAEGSTVVLLRPGFTGPVTQPGQNGQLWLGTDGTDWQPANVPCEPPAGGGAFVMSMALGHPDAWLLDCYDNEQSQQQQNTQQHLFGTIDGGQIWVRLPDPASHEMPVALADNGSGHAFLAEEGPGDVLRATFDGGLHWQTILTSGGSFNGWADLTFLTAETGFVVAPTYNQPEHLYRTDDGGRTWRILPVAAPPAVSG